jgi:hypothetical protein
LPLWLIAMPWSETFDFKPVHFFSGATPFDPSRRRRSSRFRASSCSFNRLRLVLVAGLLGYSAKPVAARAAPIKKNGVAMIAPPFFEKFLRDLQSKK